MFAYVCTMYQAYIELYSMTLADLASLVSSSKKIKSINNNMKKNSTHFTSKIYKALPLKKLTNLA